MQIGDDQNTIELWRIIETWQNSYANGKSPAEIVTLSEYLAKQGVTITIA